MAYFFFFVSLINLPVYLFLWYSNDATPTTLGDTLARLSLGSVSANAASCNSMNYASSTTIKIQCQNKYGQL